MLLPEAKAAITRAALLSGSYELAEATLTGLEIFASRDRSGKWTHQRLFPAEGPAEAETEKTETKKNPPRVVVAKAGLRRAKLHFSDAVPSGGFSTVVTADLGVEKFSTESPVPASVTLALATERRESFSFAGTFSAKPAALQGEADLAGVLLEAYYPYLGDCLASPLKGTLSASAGIGAGGGEVAVRGGKIPACRLRRLLWRCRWG